MTRRRIWTVFALLALTAAALFGALANRKLRWPDDPDSIQQRWETVRGWADLEAWSWDAELAAIIHTLRLGELLIERATEGEPEALAAALRLGARMRREGSLGHFNVGAALAQRALDLACEQDLESSRSALERWRPRDEEAFAVLAREAVETLALMDQFEPIEAAGPFTRARRSLWEREVAIAKDYYARRLAWLHEVRDDLGALARRAGDDEAIEVEVWTLMPLVELTQAAGGRLVSSFAELLDAYAAALGPG